MKYKKILSVVMVAIMCTTIANASILGTENIKNASVEIGPGAVLNTNVVYSDQSGVGFQTENYVEYTPNESLVPAIVNNDYLCNRMTVSKKGNSLLSGGSYPTMLMNSDYFSLEMGFPVSHQVIDGKIIVQDYKDTDAIGINNDGTAFIAPLSITTSIEAKGFSVPVTVINMGRQDWGIFLFTDKFATTTKAKTKGIHMQIGSLSGDISVNGTQTGIVEKIFEAEGAVEIPKGKMILSADATAADYIINCFGYFNEGDEIKITTTLGGDERWEDARYILGTIGGRLLTNSEITITDAAAAPRTAFGIKEDGTLIFYTIDGRKTGHSYGVRLNTLAKRMLELGCVDAVNMDGGGSTTLGAMYPGKDSFSVVNIPSDGYERSISNYLALINTSERKNLAEKLFLYPYMGNYLAGTEVTFTAYATDENFFKAETPGNIIYTAPDGSTSANGRLTLTGNGTVTVTAKSGNIKGNAEINCYESPTYISLRNTKRNTLVEKIDINIEESISLSPTAKVGNKYLIADPDCFTWSCTDGIGTIDSNGNFTASSRAGVGQIIVKAGKYQRAIPVNVTKDVDYTEINFKNPEEGKVIIELDSGSNATVEKENVLLKIDGKKTDFEIVADTIELNFDDEYTHKINIQIQNSQGFKTVKNYTLQGNKKHKNIFNDINDDFWATSYITYMNHHGIINGIVSGGKLCFMPSNTVTRGEFAVMFANMLGVNPSDFDSISLDMDDEDKIPSWCINHVKALCELGFMNGKNIGDKVIFDPSATLSRAEAAAVISKLLPEEMMTEEKTFTDSNKIPSWSKGAFLKLTTLGIISGYSDGSIKPANSTTRAEVIKMLYEAY